MTSSGKSREFFRRVRPAVGLGPWAGLAPFSRTVRGAGFYLPTVGLARRAGPTHQTGLPILRSVRNHRRALAPHQPPGRVRVPGFHPRPTLASSGQQPMLWREKQGEEKNQRLQ